MSFRRKRSKIRCPFCGRRGRVRTHMVRITEIHPDWRWKDDWVPARGCGRCGEGWLDHVAETVMDQHQTAREK